MDSNDFPLILSLPDLDKAHSLGYSPDGSTLAAGTDNHLRLWNARDRSELKTIRTSCLAYGLAWSPSSKHVALGCSDGRVLLFQPVP
jgi:WD40 repeat protein